MGESTRDSVVSQQKCGILVNTVISDTALPTITAPTLERLLPHPSRSLGSQFIGRTCGLRELTLIARRHRDRVHMRASLCVSREGGLTGGVEVCPQGVTSGV